jgi:hypothetical protein
MSVAQLCDEYDLNISSGEGHAGWLIQPPIADVTLGQLARLARLEERMLREIQTPAAWVTPTRMHALRSMSLREPCRRHRAAKEARVVGPACCAAYQAHPRRAVGHARVDGFALAQQRTRGVLGGGGQPYGIEHGTAFGQGGQRVFRLRMRFQSATCVQRIDDVLFVRALVGGAAFTKRQMCRAVDLALQSLGAFGIHAVRR